MLLAVAERSFLVDHLKAGPAAGVTDRARERMHQRLDDVAAHAGAELRIVSHSRPGAALADACETGVDIVIAGSRGYGPRKAVLLGSVSRHLVDHAACPVMIVPRTAHVLDDALRVEPA